MTPEQWRRIEDLFQSARMRTNAAERAAFLDGACGSDIELRAQVEGLLAAEDSAGSFINTSAMKVAAGIIAADRATEMQGKTIAHYKVLSAVGAGGMGEVYLAVDVRTGRNVALKLLPDHLVKDPEHVRRFQQEARAVLALNHPNIVTVYEIGQEDGAQFIASEFVKGETLRARMAGAPLALSEALEIATQVAAALAEAHQEGVVHRDIKPENIMLRPDGYVKVLDFGIAKLTETPPSSARTEAPTRLKVQTQPGMVLGSTHYMSPEQARGMNVDERTDIWSLGIVLYEMIAGRVPFDGETPSDCIAAILEKEAPPLTRFARDAPEALEVIVSTALSKNRDERYHSVRELLGALRRLKQRLDATAEQERSLPLQTSAGANSESSRTFTKTSDSLPSTQPVLRTTSSAEYIVSEIRQHKIVVALALALFIVVVAGAGFALYRFFSGQTVDSGSHPPKFTALTTGGKIGDLNVEGELSMSHDGKYIAYVAHEVVEGKLQSSVWVMQVSTDTQAQVVPPSTADYTATDFTPDGQFIYFGRRETRLSAPTLYRVPVIGGMPTKVLEGVTSPISFSPDGKRFAFVRDEAETRENTLLLIANTDGSGEPQVIARRKAPDYFDPNGPSWSPDGKIIVCGAGTFKGDGRMTVVGVPSDGGAEISLSTQNWFQVYRVLWLGDGSGMVMTAKAEASESGSQIWHLSYPSGLARKITNDLNAYGEASLGVASDATSIATIQTRMDVQIWVTATNDDESRARQITKGISDGVRGLSWTPDGKILYVTATGDQVDVWVVNADGSQRRQITSDVYIEGNITASPDGRYLVFSSNRAGRKLWRTDSDGNNPKQLTEGNAFEDNPSFSPDSQWIVFNSNKTGNISLWKVGINGGPGVQLSDTFAAFPTFSPDGKWIACYHPDEHNLLQLLIFPAEGGQPVKTINLPATAGPFNGRPKWSPNGDSISFVNRIDNITNVWSQPVDGSRPKPITNFKSLWLYNYAQSRDGKQLALARGDQYQDIVLIKDFR